MAAGAVAIAGIVAGRALRAAAGVIRADEDVLGDLRLGEEALPPAWLIRISKQDGLRSDRGPVPLARMQKLRRERTLNQWH